MADCRSPVGTEADPHHVEPELSAHAGMGGDPAGRGAPEPPALVPIDRLQRRLGAGAPGLDLHEGDHLAFPDDQIELEPPGAPVPVEDDEARGSESLRRELLSALPGAAQADRLAAGRPTGSTTPRPMALAMVRIWLMSSSN